MKHITRNHEPALTEMEVRFLVEAGSVGWGRCIIWCPTGIDLTEELAALLSKRKRRAATFQGHS